jgi:1-acyl-sn-glycerol-3-phosphate acyltransferase
LTIPSQHKGSKRARSNPLLALIRLLVIILFVIYVCIRHFLLMCIRDEAGKLRLGRESSSLFFLGSLRILWINIHVHGDVPQSPVLFTPNHISYMDILAVGAVCPTFFVSKVGVAHWPVVGTLFRLSQSLTIDRSKTRAVKEVNEQIAARIMGGNSVCVFLEGTTTNGHEMLPFHASLLQSTMEHGGEAVPIGIQWHTSNPRIDIQEDLAYWKDHVIGPHAFRIMGLRGIEVTLTMGVPINPRVGQDRKEFANDLRSEVNRLLQKGIDG